MAVVKVTRNHQISIPKEIRDVLGIEEGDLVEMREEGGRVVLIPKRLIDAGQAWFWTRDWQEGEQEAQEDIREGRVSGPFQDIEELRKHLGS